MPSLNKKPGAKTKKVKEKQVKNVASYKEKLLAASNEVEVQANTIHCSDKESNNNDNNDDSFCIDDMDDDRSAEDENEVSHNNDDGDDTSTTGDSENEQGPYDVATEKSFGFDAKEEEIKKKIAAYEKAKNDMLSSNYKIVGKKSNTKKTITWKLVKDSTPTSVKTGYDEIGIRGFDFENTGEFPAADMFWHLWPFSHREMMDNINHHLKRFNEKFRDKRHQVKLTSEHEIVMFFCILIGTSGYTERGEALLHDTRLLPSDVPQPEFEKRYGMRWYRFQCIFGVFPYFLYQKILHMMTMKIHGGQYVI